MHLDLLSIPLSGGKMSKRSGGIIGCKDKTSSWHLDGFLDVTVVTLGQQYSMGEKFTVIQQLRRHNKSVIDV